MKQKAQVNRFDIYRYSVILVIVVPLIVYISAIQLGFVYFDDDILILGNFEKLSNLSNIGAAFLSDAFFANRSPYYRPLMNVSFMVDAIIGGNSPAIYHFSNICYHILACLSLLWFLQLLQFSKSQSLIIALIFSVHPVMGHAVLWIPARGDLLVTLYSILTIIFLIKFFKDQKYNFLVLHLLFFSCALFSKESAIFLPFFFIFFMFIKKEQFFTVKRIPVYLSWFGVFLFWFYMRDITIDHRADNQVGLSPLMHNLPFLPEAITRLIFPFNLPVTPVFSSGYTIAGILIFIAFLFIIFRQKFHPKTILIIFGSVWFLGFCFPSMFVRLSSADDSFEYLLHRIYLPSIGFMIMLLGLLPERWFEMKSKQNSFIILTILVLFIFYDFIQQKKYKDAVSFWSSSINYAPERSWFPYFLGRYYFKQKDMTNYENLLLKADSVKTYPIFRYNLGMIYYTDRKNYEKAYSYFASAFKQGYSDNEARANFVLFCIESSCVFFKNNQIDKAIARCSEALNNDSANSLAAYDMGLFLITKGEKQNAASMWRRAIKNKPDLKDAYKSLSLYYFYDMKNHDSAIYFANQYKKFGGTEAIINK
ncbi:MAG: glycosyltransferase family 39 protein [Bacteroidetes bacterium]|nr:glycosyltransferase family 39 protein [Bacteroidota bacterium]